MDEQELPSERCEGCGLTEWNGQPIPLMAVNGRLICHNCDAYLKIITNEQEHA